MGTSYTLHGKNIVHMLQEGDELHFFYDADNKPAVVLFNSTAYAYLSQLIAGKVPEWLHWMVLSMALVTDLWQEALLPVLHLHQSL